MFFPSKKGLVLILAAFALHSLATFAGERGEYEATALGVGGVVVSGGGAVAIVNGLHEGRAASKAMNDSLNEKVSLDIRKWRARQNIGLSEDVRNNEFKSIRLREASLLEEQKKLNETLKKVELKLHLGGAALVTGAAVTGYELYESLKGSFKSQAPMNSSVASDRHAPKKSEIPAAESPEVQPARTLDPHEASAE